MRIEYIKNLNHSYMIVKEAEYEYENYELLMLLNNKIRGLLDLQVIVGDGKLEFWYDITGMTALDTLLDMVLLEQAQICSLTESIFDMNRGLEEFLLEEKNIAYSPEMIFFDRKKENYKFCYLPGCKVIPELHLQSLMEYLLTKIDHTDQKAVKTGYALYEKSTEEGCSLEELLSCTVSEVEEEETLAGSESAISEKKEIRGQKIQTSWLESEEETDQMELEDETPQQARPFWQRFFGIGKTVGKAGEKKPVESDQVYADCLAENISYQTIWEKEKEETNHPTVFLKTDENYLIGRLLYQGNHQEADFLLEEDSFLIGKDASAVQGVISADGVSRIHARIEHQPDGYFLTDLNSTNGTYVNGNEVLFRDKVRLERNDMITFASEPYRFC